MAVVHSSVGCRRSHNDMTTILARRMNILCNSRSQMEHNDYDVRWIIKVFIGRPTAFAIRPSATPVGCYINGWTYRNMLCTTHTIHRTMSIFGLGSSQRSSDFKGWRPQSPRKGKGREMNREVRGKEGKPWSRKTITLSWRSDLIIIIIIIII